MTSIGPYDIKGWRVALGLGIGAAIPVGINTVLSFRLWLIALIVGTVAAVLFVFLIGLPIYRFLRGRQMLTMYAAVVIGGLLTALPDLLMTVVGMANPGLKTLVVNHVVLVADGRLTGAGWVHFFVWRPFVLYFPMGAVGGLVAWLIAVGFRIRPRRISAGA
jgi:hypothetical protein